MGIEFSVCEMTKNNWNDVPGVYIFTKIDQPSNTWIPLYVGETKSFMVRFSDHEKWYDGIRLGATHVHAVVIRDDVHRVVVERQLIEAFRPPLNGSA